MRKRIEYMYLKTAGCERIKRDYNKKSERYWDDEIYQQKHNICESSETHTSQNISCMSC